MKTRSGVRRLAGLSACAALLALAAPASAQFTQNATGIPGPVYTVTFDEHTFPNVTFVTNQWQDVGVTFTPVVYLNVILAALPNINGNRVGNSAVGKLQNPFSVHFTEARSAAALALAANSGTVRFTARLNGADVATAVAPASTTLTTNFYGFSGIAFDEIAIQQLTSSASFGVLIDNIQLGPVAAAPCYPDCNQDAALTIADFGCFQGKFVAQDPYADCNGDTALTIADFACFQAEFVAGCP